MIQVLNNTLDILTFGKYKGKTVEVAMSENASYFTWCEEKNIVRLSENLRVLVNNMAAEQRRNYLDSIDGMNYPDDDWGDRY